MCFSLSLSSLSASHCKVRFIFWPGGWQGGARGARAMGEHISTFLANFANGQFLSAL